MISDAAAKEVLKCGRASLLERSNSLLVNDKRNLGGIIFLGGSSSYTLTYGITKMHK